MVCGCVQVVATSSFIVLIFKEFLTCKKSTNSHTCSAFTLASSELGQTGLVLFSKVDISKVTARYILVKCQLLY